MRQPASYRLDHSSDCIYNFFILTATPCLIPLNPDQVRYYALACTHLFETSYNPAFQFICSLLFMRIYRGIPPCPHAPLAITIGNFDGVHLGHQAILAQLANAAKQRNLTDCVLTFEPHPREFFMPAQAPARLTGLRDKLALLAASGVEQVQICRFNPAFAKMPAEAFIVDILQHKLAARWILVGQDFRFGARRTGDVAMLKQFASRCNFEVAEIENVTIDGLRVSSTAIRQALAAGDLGLARRLLGRPYSISGRVIHGNKLGRKLGFPTANIHLKSGYNRPPLSGIFAVTVNNKTIPQRPLLQGVASLGVRPAVHTDGKLVLEVYLFDFDEEIYGHHLQVNFLHKLRDEEKYPDLETLTSQIAQDVENAKDYFRSCHPSN